MPQLNSWFSQEKDKADFRVVYVREAHPTDGNQARPNIRDGVLVTTHKTLAEREEAATHCAKEMGIKIPIIIDNMDDKVEKAYQGFPDRIYIVGTNGKIAYKGKKGPAGFDPDEAAQALKNLTQ